MQSYAERDYRGLLSVTETSYWFNLSMAGIILLFSATDDTSSSHPKIMRSFAGEGIMKRSYRITGSQDGQKKGLHNI